MDSKYYNSMSDTIYNLDRSIDRYCIKLANSYDLYDDFPDKGNGYRKIMFNLIKRKTKLIKNIVDMHDCDIQMSLNIQMEILQDKIKSFNLYKRKD